MKPEGILREERGNLQPVDPAAGDCHVTSFLAMTEKREKRPRKGVGEKSEKRGPRKGVGDK
ncbi:uncharacterized protein FOKN1_2995 [Thiohalobacter thiocyanaticus]|uniref:Uncharacterized protein n=1 Tax=Thiohalobacter thiocyanaticus TaxID=585455 RepID=A0A1Z4VV62_9GAMM|nr:uncharacterized protein FOKN1_2995 [Thiohalobacter thiocyanaticus]